MKPSDQIKFHAFIYVTKKGDEAGINLPAKWTRTVTLLSEPDASAKRHADVVTPTIIIAVSGIEVGRFPLDATTGAMVSACNAASIPADVRKAFRMDE